MAIIGTMAVGITANTKGLNDGLRKAGASVGGFSDKTRKLAEQTRLSTRNMGAGFENVGASISNMTKPLRTFSGAISQTAGIATQFRGALLGVSGVAVGLAATTAAIASHFSDAAAETKRMASHLETVAKRAADLGFARPTGAPGVDMVLFSELTARRNELQSRLDKMVQRQQGTFGQLRGIASVAFTPGATTGELGGPTKAMRELEKELDAVNEQLSSLTRRAKREEAELARRTGLDDLVKGMTASMAENAMDFHARRLTGPAAELGQRSGPRLLDHLLPGANPQISAGVMEAIHGERDDDLLEEMKSMRRDVRRIEEVLERELRQAQFPVGKFDEMVRHLGRLRSTA